MNKILRALLISATATGVAAVVVSKMQQVRKSESPAPDQKPFMVDAESLSEEEKDQLTNELDAML